MDSEKYYELLRKSRFMENAPEKLIRQAANIGSEIFIHSGETLFQKGESGDSMYIILDGHIRVHDGDLFLNTLSPGHVIGEIASLGSLERTASITAEEDTTLLEINCKNLFDTLANEDGFTKSLVSMLCAREKSMANKVTDRSMRVRSLERELEIGREIQSYFLPQTLPDTPGWNISAYFQAAHEVAGDFYDVFTVQSINRVGLVIGDVCDKGVGAALFMTLFRSLLRATALSKDFNNWSIASETENNKQDENRNLDSEVEKCLLNSVQLTNNYIAQTHGDTSMFASVFFALLDLETGVLNYINAGHEEPVIFSHNNIKQRLGTTGPVVGIFPGAKYETAMTTLDHDDSLLIFTDGITEALSVDGKQFSETRLLSLLEKFTGNADELLPEILNSLNDFTKGEKQFDDNTFLTINRNPGH